MERIKFIIVGVILCIGLILIASDSANGSAIDTILIKLGGLVALAVVPLLWRFFHLDDNEQIQKFLDE